MRKLALAFGLVASLALASFASAATPQKGPWAGEIAGKAVNGFKPLVRFTAASTGTKLTKFTFETLGCFGVGQYPTGVDPFELPSSVGTIALIPVVKGKYTIAKAPAKFVDAEGTKTTATVTGAFTSAKATSGTILVTQSYRGETCKQTLRYYAEPGTPDSLGLN